MTFEIEDTSSGFCFLWEEFGFPPITILVLFYRPGNIYYIKSIKL